MPDLKTVSEKFKGLIGALELRPERVNAQLGDGNGVVSVAGRPGYVHVRLEDGTYHGVAFNNKVPFQNDLLVVVGYSHETPNLFQVLEARTSPAATASTVPPVQISDVTGCVATWQQDDCLITWTALPPSSLLHNYRVTVDDVHYLTTSPRLLYTRGMNEADHSGTWASSLTIGVVAVDVYGGISVTPAVPTPNPTVWTRQTVPNVTSGTATWFHDDCLFNWSDVVRPYTFQNFLVTIGAVTFVTLTTSFTYTNAQNRIDHGGTPATTISASIVAVDRDGFTSYIPLVINTTNTSPTADTIQDNFDTYGGDVIAQGGSEALYWLSLIEAEGDTDEVFFSAVHGELDAHFAVQGNTSALFDSFGNNLHKAGVFDLTSEGRFTAGDYVVWSMYAANTTIRTIGVYFADGAGKNAGYNTELSTAGWHYFAVKRSDFSVDAGFAWSNVVQIRGIVQASANEINFDDLRMVKADPDDAATFNDTGAAWDFNGGVWHIYQDVPQVPFALGQIDTVNSSTRRVALRAGAYVASNHFAAGVLLRNDGSVGLLGYAADAGNGYEVRLNSASDLLELVKWVNGTSTTLAVVDYNGSLNTRYTLGLMRTPTHVKVYISDGSAPIFSAATLKMSVADTTYYQGKLGVVSYGINSRFFQVRAGSPEHALFAEYAAAADTLDGLHAADFRQAIAPATVNAVSTDLTSVVALCNQLRAALIANGLCE